MLEIQLNAADCLSNRRAAKLKDELLDHRHYDRVIGGPCGQDTIVRKPDEEPALVYLRHPKRVQRPLRDALPALRVAATWSENQQAPSGLIGFLDPTPREPYYRKAAFTRDNPEGWALIVPLLQALARELVETLPDYHGWQMGYWRRVNPDFRIPRTSFTTGTVNDTHRFKCHRHTNNLKCGRGAMVVWREGAYRGGFFMLPQYKIAVNMQCGDVVLFSGLDWHANSPFYADGPFERISVVAYLRSKMIYAGTAKEELEKAQQLNSHEA